jgi:hypothetical protein
MVASRFKYVLICSCLMGLISTTDLLGGQPVLSGRVFLATPRGNAVLRNVTVRLLTPGSNVVKAQTYSDSNGRYAIYQVIAGSYEIQFLVGNSVLKQRIGNQRKDRVLIKISPATSKAVDVIVEK